jgi:hypothetical protein
VPHAWNLNKTVADYMHVSGAHQEYSGPAYDPASMKGYHYLVEDGAISYNKVFKVIDVELA